MRNLMKHFYHFLMSLFFKFKTKTLFVGNVKVHYIFKKGQSKGMIVVFSGFAGHNIKARYNYYSSLRKNKKSNILFILDDFGYKKVGSYYLGDACQLYKNRVVETFLSIIKKQHSIMNTIFLGTSKGGSSALIYGLETEASEIIIGSPQYLIGDYLNENEYHKLILHSILDEKNGYDVAFLNNLIPSIINKSDKASIVLIYSSLEQDYDSDISKLISQLKEKKSFNLTLIDKEFANHGEIALFFKEFLLSDEFNSLL